MVLFAMLHTHQTNVGRRNRTESEMEIATERIVTEWWGLHRHCRLITIHTFRFALFFDAGPPLTTRGGGNRIRSFGPPCRTNMA